MPIKIEQLERMSTQDPGLIPPFCVSCGYSLVGAVSQRCPECGAYFVAKEWRQKVAQVKRCLEQINEAKVWVRIGVKIALAGWLLWLLSIFFGGPLSGPFLRGIAAICGMIATFLGLSAVRAMSLPKWMRELVEIKLDYSMTIADIIIGASLAGLIIFGP
ncbi:MAG: hypothetical protein JSU63_00865 [Phycisphaerales bacterium]|nr:MAG: hypothetical protein JSU63_00865 [Phycisphaerales bacterium]